MSKRGWIASAFLLLAVAATGGGIAARKYATVQAARLAEAHQPEPMETVALATARAVEHRPTTTAIGTVVALRSITLRNEVPGTVASVMLEPGAIVEAGTVLVLLDVSVEGAELKAQQATAALAEALLARMERAAQGRAASEAELDRARAERDVSLAQVARTRALIGRKTITAPFRARVGLSDVHVGQYLVEGSFLTTLQGVDDAVHVDFAVPQRVAAGLKVGDGVEVFAGAESAPVPARIVAFDSRIQPETRNAVARARIDGLESAPPPGAAVRVQVPVGPARTSTAILVSALRRGPSGDHVFVVAPDADGNSRASVRPVQPESTAGDEVMIRAGLAPGEHVAASGSFKLRDGALVQPLAAGEPGASR